MVAPGTLVSVRLVSQPKSRGAHGPKHTPKFQSSAALPQKRSRPRATTVFHTEGYTRPYGAHQETEGPRKIIKWPLEQNEKSKDGLFYEAKRKSKGWTVLWSKLRVLVLRLKCYILCFLLLHKMLYTLIFALLHKMLNTLLHTHALTICRSKTKTQSMEHFMKQLEKPKYGTSYEAKRKSKGWTILWSKLRVCVLHPQMLHTLCFRFVW